MQVSVLFEKLAVTEKQKKKLKALSVTTEMRYTLSGGIKPLCYITS